MKIGDTVYFLDPKTYKNYKNPRNSLAELQYVAKEAKVEKVGKKYFSVEKDDRKYHLNNEEAIKEHYWLIYLTQDEYSVFKTDYEKAYSKYSCRSSLVRTYNSFRHYDMGLLKPPTDDKEVLEMNAITKTLADLEERLKNLMY